MNETGNPRVINRVGAQGDVFFLRVDALPEGVREVPQVDGRHVIAHSETGHHHITRDREARFYEDPRDPFTCYLRVDGEHADVEHLRPFDTHETVRLLRGITMCRRSREYVPEGFRRVED